MTRQNSFSICNTSLSNGSWVRNNYLLQPHSANSKHRIKVPNELTLFSLLLNNQSNELGMNSKVSLEPRVKDILRVFKTNLSLMFVLVFGASLILLAFPDLASTLMASSRNILSAFTSVFVHRDLAHLAASVTLTLAILLLYSLSITISCKKSNNFFILAIWISTVFATLAFVNLAPNARLGGSSGLVSAFLSGAVITAYVGAWSEPVLRIKIAQIAIGTVLVAIFVVLNLNVGSGSMVIVHLSAFFNMTVIVLAKLFFSSFFSKRH